MQCRMTQAGAPAPLQDLLCCRTNRYVSSLDQTLYDGLIILLQAAQLSMHASFRSKVHMYVAEVQLHTYVLYTVSMAGLHAGYGH